MREVLSTDVGRVLVTGSTDPAMTSASEGKVDERSGFKIRHMLGRKEQRQLSILGTSSASRVTRRPASPGENDSECKKAGWVVNDPELIEV